jgi:hypothetical protein
MPGSDPAGRFAEALFEDGGLGPELRDNGIADAPALAAALAHDPAALAEIVKTALDAAAQQRAVDKKYDAPRPARLLVGIDQLEWLFIEATAEEIEIFLEACAWRPSSRRCVATPTPVSRPSQHWWRCTRQGRHMICCLRARSSLKTSSRAR